MMKGEEKEESPEELKKDKKIQNKILKEKIENEDYDFQYKFTSIYAQKLSVKTSHFVIQKANLKNFNIYMTTAENSIVNFVLNIPTDLNPLKKQLSESDLLLKDDISLSEPTTIEFWGHKAAIRFLLISSNDQLLLSASEGNYNIY